MNICAVVDILISILTHHPIGMQPPVLKPPVGYLPI